MIRDHAAAPDAAVPGQADVTFRQPRLPDDWAAMADLRTTAYLADGVDEVVSGEDLALEWGNLEGMDPARDVRLAEVGGRLVGLTATRLLPRDDILSLESWGSVHPDLRRHGIGQALLAWAESHLARRAAEDPRPGRRELRGWALEIETGTLALLECAGYDRIRYGFEMRRPLGGALPEHPLLAGLDLRPVTPDQHRAIFAAEDEAFRDHWGSHAFTEGDFVSTFEHPETDTSLWQVAWDGDEVAGVVDVSIYRRENEQLGLARGWLDRVSVRRPWRGRGLARALCSAALHALRERGMDEAWLGVDAANPTGALRLYEDLGFLVARRWFVFGRPLPDQ